MLVAGRRGVDALATGVLLSYTKAYLFGFLGFYPFAVYNFMRSTTN